MKRAIALALTIAAIAGFVALGVWQLERRQWKLALIERTEARLARPPVPPPPRGQWGSVTAADAYTRVAVTGRWVPVTPAYAQAATEFGGGYWALSPLETGVGTILVNRGFVPTDMRGRLPVPVGQTKITGLLRISEPDGGFLRRNDPATDRWYSRDTAAIGATRQLGPVAPYFIDADAAAPGTRWPRGGMTVVRFRNSHLSYALTWFGLATLTAGMAWYARRR